MTTSSSYFDLEQSLHCQDDQLTLLAQLIQHNRVILPRVFGHWLSMYALVKDDMDEQRKIHGALISADCIVDDEGLLEDKITRLIHNMQQNRAKLHSILDNYQRIPGKQHLIIWLMRLTINQQIKFITIFDNIRLNIREHDADCDSDLSPVFDNVDDLFNHLNRA